MEKCKYILFILDRTAAYVKFEVVILLGIVCCGEGKRGAFICVEQVGGLSCVRATVSEARRLNGIRQRLCLAQIRNAFRTHGVRRVVLSQSLPCAEQFREWRAVNPMPFYRGIADLLALGTLEDRNILPQSAVVGLAGARLTYEIEMTARRLCPLIRGISVDVPGEGEWFAGWLHREYGIAVRSFGESDVTLAFGPCARSGETCIDLTDEAEGSMQFYASVPGLWLPEGCEETMLAALWECGRLERSQIRINRRDEGISS